MRLMFICRRFRWLMCIRYLVGFSLIGGLILLIYYMVEDPDLFLRMQTTLSPPPLSTLKPGVDMRWDSPVIDDPSWNVHIFYYPWYGSPELDNGSYYHWNHEYLPHWNKEEAKKWPQGRHVPPDDIGSNFYPLLGCYSSHDSAALDKHMQWIRSASVGVLVVTWYPPGQHDSQGRSFDEFIYPILDTANRYRLRVALHIEPYDGRNVTTLRKHLEYIHSMYAWHPAFYMVEHKGKMLPLYYVYDSYLISDNEWKSLLSANGLHTVRNTELDAVFVGIVVKDADKTKLLSAGFDGYYTYFGANGFSYGSDWKRWRYLQLFAKKNDMYFIPCVAPGYIDERVRPWNKATTRPRQFGQYYNDSWTQAVQSQADFVAITSFNEWHEGTQIEPAVPKTYFSIVDGEYRYMDYDPDGPEFYLKLTRTWVKHFTAEQTQRFRVNGGKRLGPYG